MAILPLIPGLEVKILVDGVPLVEYQDEDEDVDPRAEEVTRYIECQAGSYFSIQTKFSPHFPCATTDTIVSGVLVNGKSTESVARNLDYRRLRPTSEQMGPSFEENGSWKQQQYQFTDLPKSEEGGNGGSLQLLKDLGTITVCHFRAVAIGTGQCNHKPTELGIDSVPEKKLKGKAISHQVKLGKAQTVRALGHTKVSYPYGREPFATYNFCYRSRASLHSLGLVARSPSPVPLEDRPMEELTREELLEVLRTEKERQTQETRIKKEVKRERTIDDDDDNGDDDEVIVVQSKRIKTHKTTVNVATGVETIDLSD